MDLIKGPLSVHSMFYIMKIHTDLKMYPIKDKEIKTYTLNSKLLKLAQKQKGKFSTDFVLYFLVIVQVKSKFSVFVWTSCISVHISNVQWCEIYMYCIKQTAVRVCGQFLQMKLIPTCVFRWLTISRCQD